MGFEPKGWGRITDMSKKSNVQKLKANRKRKHTRGKHPRGMRPNPMAGLTAEQVADAVMFTSFGTVGTALLKAFGVSPIRVLEIAVQTEADGAENA